MIDQNDAAEDLLPLAAPTLQAFVTANRRYAAYHEAIKPWRGTYAPQVAGLTDGVNYWAMFATEIVTTLRGVGIQRDAGTHPLLHQWTLPGGVVLQLKSDTGNLPHVQMPIPGLAVPRTGGPRVLLTWDHTHEDRHDPAFVHMSGKREVWRIPVEALVASPTPMPTTVAAPTLTSKRKQASGERADASSS